MSNFDDLVEARVQMILRQKEEERRRQEEEQIRSAIEREARRRIIEQEMEERRRQEEERRIEEEIQRVAIEKIVGELRQLISTKMTEIEGHRQAIVGIQKEIADINTEIHSYGYKPVSPVLRETYTHTETTTEYEVSNTDEAIVQIGNMSDSNKTLINVIRHHLNNKGTPQSIAKAFRRKATTEELNMFLEDFKGSLIQKIITKLQELLQIGIVRKAN